MLACSRARVLACSRKVLVEELERAHRALQERDASLARQAETLAARERALEEAREQVQLLEQQYRRLLEENGHLLHRIDQLCRARFGESSEKVDAAQLALAFAEIEAEDQKAADAQETPAPPRPARAPPPPRKGHGRRPLPPHLPRERVEHPLGESERRCPCCQKPMRAIDEEVSEQLDYVPASYRVIEHVRFKYACPTCQEGVVISPPAEKIVEKGRAGPGLLAHVIVSKYADHLPLYRQAERMAREGIDVARSTLLGLVQAGARLLEPVAREIGREILEDPVVHADETPTKTKRRPSGTLTGYLFTFTDREQVLFRYQPGRSGALALAFFKGYAGTIVMDEYAGYDAIFAEGAATRAGCWTHARRGFFDALSSDPARASRVLAKIQLLYRVERDAKGLSDEERLRLRQAKSRPLVTEVRQALDGYVEEVLPKSPIGKAVQFVRNAWDHLERFLEDGRVPIDNSAAERAIRPIAVGRKNWLAFGSERGGRDGATLFTLLGSCKMQHVNPFEYLRDVLPRLGTHPASRIAELTPRGWRAARAALEANPALATPA